jgi:hypothetical protein
MASGNTMIDELDFEISGSSALRQHLEQARQFAIAMHLELEFAAAELQGRLEKTEPTEARGGWAARRRAARQVTRGYKRMAEYSLAIAQLTPRTWAMFVRNYVNTDVQPEKSKKFDVDA